jgi:hypothetical protein
MGLSIKGYILDPPRVGAANSPYTMTPNVYISDQVAFDVAYPSDESAPRTEYHVFVLTDGDFPTCTFCWTKNEVINRFEYNGRAGRFRTMPGGPPDEVGTLTAGANTTRLVVAVPSSSDLASYPVRLSVGPGVGMAFTVALVAQDSDLNSPDPPAGTVQLSQASGKLGWAPADLVTYLDQAVRFQRQSYFTSTEVSGALGTIEDTLILNPLPATGQYPLLRIGFAEYLVPIEVMSFGTPVSGTVEWKRGTGELLFNTTDVANNPGKTVYYDGTCFGFDLSASTTSLGTVSTPGTLWPLPPEGSDLFFRIPGVTQFSETVFVDAFTGFPTFGRRDRVEVRRSDGQIQFSFGDQIAYGLYSIQAVVADLDIERGLTLRMFRTPVDPKAQDNDLKDVSAYYVTTEATWADPIMGFPFVTMPAQPVENPQFKVQVQQGTGTFPEIELPRLDEGSPSAGWGVVLDYNQRQLKYAKRVEDEVLSAAAAPIGGNPSRRMPLVRGPFGTLQLPNPLVFESDLLLELEDSPNGGTYTPLVIDDDILFDYSTGLITFVNTEGTSQASGVGATFSGTTFTDLDQDFSAAGVQSGDLLFVNSSTPNNDEVGVYTVDAVGTSSITTDLPASAPATAISYEIWRGGEVLADRYFKEIPSVDPNTSVERLNNLGTTINSPRLSIDTTYIDVVRFRFGKDTFSTSVVQVTAFTSPASLSQGTVEIDEVNGELNFSQADVDAGLDVYWSRTLELGVDYQLQPPLGTVQFTQRMLENEEVYLAYAVLDEDSNQIPVEERGTFIVRKELTADHPSPTSTLSFNPLGREVAENPVPQAFRGGRPQTSRQVSFDTEASTVTFIGARTVTDALPSGPVINSDERVYIDYYVHEAIGGEKTLTVLQPPMVGAFVNIEAEQDRLTILGDVTDIYKANHLLRVDRSEVYLIGSSTYDAGTGLTTIVLASPQTFRSDLLNPSMEVTSGATRTSAFFFFPSYFTTEFATWDTPARGEAKLYIRGDHTRTYVGGTAILFTDGGTFLDFNLVEGSTYSNGKTEVVLSSNGARQYNPASHTLKHSVRPILSGATADVSTTNTPLLDQGYRAYRRVEGEVGQILVEPDDYSISDAGRVSFTDPLVENEELVLLYTGTTLIEAGRHVRATYTHAAAPSSDNGLTGQVLKVDFTTYAPDTFYWRVETFTNFRGELTEQYEGEAQASIPTGGPVLENVGQPRLYEQGRESLYYSEGRLYNEDEVARPTLVYYNDAINYLEDCLQHMDGRVVGDHDGRFLFDGSITNPQRASYADVTNQIDDILKVAEPPISIQFSPFSIAWLGTYQEAYKPATFSRFYPTYRSRFGMVIAGATTGDPVLDIGYTNLRSVSSVTRRLPWAIVTQKALAGATTLVVDSTEREEDLLRPAWPPVTGAPPIYDVFVLIQDRDGTFIQSISTLPYLQVTAKTTTSLTLSAGVPADVPVGATVYHVPVYIPLILPPAFVNSPVLKTYRLNLDVGVDLKNGTLTYIQPFFPLDGTISPSPIPDELVISPPLQEELLDVQTYLNNSLTEPFRFPALDGGTTDDDSNRSFPLLTPSPESELGLSKTENGAPTPDRDIGYLSQQDTAIPDIQAITTDGLVTTADISGTLITKSSGNWPTPVPKAGDLVEALDGLNGPSTYYRIASATASNITVTAPFPFVDTGVTIAVTVSASRATGVASGTLTTTTQFDDPGALFLTGPNPISPGHTLYIPALAERRQVVLVPLDTQLITEAFSGTGAGLTYNVDDSILTYGGTNSLFDDSLVTPLSGLLDVLRDNAPPTKPWAEVEALERFLDHVFTDVLTSSNGETASGFPTLDDSTVDFQAAGVGAGHYVYIRAGNSAGIYAVDTVLGPQQLSVDTATPFPDTATGISYRIVSALGATITTLEAVYTALANIDQTIADVTTFQSLLNTTVPVIGDAGAFATRVLYSDLNDWTTTVAGRKTQLDPTTGDIANLEAAMTSGDRWYDKRYTWIDARTNLEKGILPKKDLAVTNRLKAQAEILKQLTKLLTVRVAT